MSAASGLSQTKWASAVSCGIAKLSVCDINVE